MSVMRCMHDLTAWQVTVNNPDPLMTLNEYIRTVANLKVSIS